MKLLRRILPVFLCLVLLLSLPAAAYAADGDGTEPYALTVRIGDTEARVRAFDDAYENNLYLSLTDLSAALSGTEKQFHLAYGYNDTDGSTFTGRPGAATERSRRKRPVRITSPCAATACSWTGGSGSITPIVWGRTCT